MGLYPARYALYILLPSILLAWPLTGIFHAGARTTGFPSSLNADSIVKTRQIPVLCYHNIRDRKSTDHKYDMVYIVSPTSFREQMQALHDSGYHTILPDQLMAYFKKGTGLPPKPVMLTFDDADGSQIEHALPVLNKTGFKGVFFIMTVVLGHGDYMTKEQVKMLTDEGHVIGSHTWNHKMVTKYKKEDWPLQIEQPIAELEKITGKPVRYFSFPYGVWNTRTIDSLKKHGIDAAFRLGGPNDKEDPFYTIKRIIVDGHWNTAQFSKAVKTQFGHH
jgi:peptidoglycan/xylan/chitin deacetylase (PgdA/CDA1 family)